MKVTSSLSLGYNQSQVIVSGKNIWVSCAGNYYDQPAGIWCIDASTQKVITKGLESTAISKMCLAGDNLYAYNTDYTGDSGHDFYKISASTGKILYTGKLPSSNPSISIPYGICVDETSGNIYLTDAIDYNLSPGQVYCFDKNLSLKWSATTGIFPGHLLLQRKWQ